MPASPRHPGHRRAKRIVITVGAAATVSAVWSAGLYVASAGETLTANEVRVAIRMAVMPKGVTPSARLEGGVTILSWTAQQIVPGVKMKSYVVTAHDVSPAHHLAVAHSVNASGGSTERFAFATAELGAGRWRWTITPHFDAWIGDEGDPSTDIALPASPTSSAADTTALMTAHSTAPKTTRRSVTSTPMTPAGTPSPANTSEAAPAGPPDAPEKSESPKADPAPSESSSDIAPSPTGSADK